MPSEQPRKLVIDWLLCHLRWIWLLIAFGIAQFATPSAAGINISAIYVTLGLGFLYNAIVLGMLFVGWFPSWAGTTVAGFDTILAIALIWLSGGYLTPMIPVALFVVISIALHISPEAGLLSATPIVLTYGVSLIVRGNANMAALLNVAVQSVALFLAAAVAGYVSQRQVRINSQQDKDEIDRLRVENERAQAIYEMANTLSSTLNYHKVLRAMVDLAYMALSEANKGDEKEAPLIGQDSGVVGMVMLFEEKGPLGQLKLVVGRNIPRLDENKKVPAKEGILAEAIYRAEAVISNNVQHDPALRNFSALQHCHSLVCAPLRAGFDAYGLVLFASPRRNYYTREHASLLVTFCNQAIIALQNAQLYADLELEQKKLLEKEAQSRRELARNLHDGPTQAISSIAMRLNFVSMILKRENDVEKAVEEVEKIEQLALKTTQEIRTMLFTLRPVVLETQGLAAAIHQYAERLHDLDGLNIELDIDRYNGQLPTEKEGIIFAIIEEAIGNAKKYSEAELIKVKMGANNNYFIAEVSDDGCGFDVSAVQSNYDQRGSLGLINMEERAQMVGGQCKFVSAVGKGTTVRVEVPLSRNSGMG